MTSWPPRISTPAPSSPRQSETHLKERSIGLNQAYDHEERDGYNGHHGEAPPDSARPDRVFVSAVLRVVEHHHVVPQAALIQKKLLSQSIVEQFVFE